MIQLIHDFLRYLKAVYVESGRWVFAIFDIIGIVLFFQPRFAEGLTKDVQLIRMIGGSIFLLSFMIANFKLYRKLSPKSLDEAAIRLYPHRTKTSSAILMKYVGNESAVDLVVTLSYKDKNGETKKIPVTQFFTANDPAMKYNPGPVIAMEPGQENYFFILGGEENSEGKVKVQISFTGAKTGTPVKYEQDFLL